MTGSCWPMVFYSITSAGEHRVGRLVDHRYVDTDEVVLVSTILQQVIELDTFACSSQ